MGGGGARAPPPPVPPPLSMYMRASRAQASLENFCIFTLKNCYFFFKFCWYFRNFVGTNDILVGLHVPTDFQMYQRNSETALLGQGPGGNFPPGPSAPAPPPPPGLYASVVDTHSINSHYRSPGIHPPPPPPGVITSLHGHGLYPRRARDC